MDNIGSIIKSQRIKNNITQMDLAKQLGVSQASVALWESGKRDFPFSIAKEICSFLSIDANYLLGLTSYNSFDYSLSCLNSSTRNIITKVNLLEENKKDLVLALLDSLS